jgi:hypothetical protein
MHNADWSLIKVERINVNNKDMCKEANEKLTLIDHKSSNNNGTRTIRPGNRDELSGEKV